MRSRKTLLSCSGERSQPIREGEEEEVGDSRKRIDGKLHIMDREREQRFEIYCEISLCV
jgi:hypothetical protein